MCSIVPMLKSLFSKHEGAQGLYAHLKNSREVLRTEETDSRKENIMPT